jgi:hypothetical protein
MRGIICENIERIKLVDGLSVITSVDFPTIVFDGWLKPKSKVIKAMVEL